MNAFDVLKTACKASANYTSFEHIKPGFYDVQRFKIVNTKFGKKVVVMTEEFDCFLPERFLKGVTPQVVDALNSETYVMKYYGKDPTRHNRVMVDFEKKNPQSELSEYLTIIPNGDGVTSMPPNNGFNAVSSEPIVMQPSNGFTTVNGELIALTNGFNTFNALQTAGNVGNELPSASGFKRN